MDFIADAVFDGRKIRCLTIVDNYSRKCMAIEVGQGLKGSDVVSVLEDAKEKIEIWREEYNTFRPHSCLGDMTPEMFIEKHVKTAEFSTLEHS